MLPPMQHIISCNSPLFERYCSKHIFPEGEDVQIPNIGYAGNADWIVYHGRMDPQPCIRVKLWFGGPAMGDETTKDFYQCITECLDRWKRVSAHKHIATFYGLVQGPAGSGLPILVTPLYKEDINEHLHSNPEVDPLRLLVKVANAVEYLHSFNPPITHGGIRGNNILIDGRGEPLLTDLGLEFLPQVSGASAMDAHFDNVRWWAPELILPPDDCAGEYNNSTPKTDVFSFGMTILEVLSKDKPWATKKRNNTVVYELSEGRRPPRPGPEHKAITNEVWDLIQECYAQEPHRRPNMKVVAGTLTVFMLRIHFPIS